MYASFIPIEFTITLPGSISECVAKTCPAQYLFSVLADLAELGHVQQVEDL
jgi:hypothetical protein